MQRSISPQAGGGGFWPDKAVLFCLLWASSALSNCTNTLDSLAQLFLSLAELILLGSESYLLRLQILTPQKAFIYIQIGCRWSKAAGRRRVSLSTSPPPPLHSPAFCELSKNGPSAACVTLVTLCLPSSLKEFLPRRSKWRFETTGICKSFKTSTRRLLLRQYERVWSRGGIGGGLQLRT